jgi:mannosylglycerate hydrolase
LPYLLPGVLSARLYLKQLNAAGQTWLERYAEPFAAQAWLRGRRYDAGLLWTAWEILVQNHPHDSICGCSIDQVHREMIARFEQSRQIAVVVAEKSIEYLNQLIDTSDLAEGDLALVVHNPLPWRRECAAGVLIDRQLGAGPGTHVVYDAGGREVPFQVKQVDRLQPIGERWQFAELRLVADVPALGYITYRLSKRPTPLDPKQLSLTAVQQTARLKGSAPVTDLRVGDGVIENRWLRVEVDRALGTMHVTDKATGAVYAGLNGFADGGDAGDSYNYAAPLNDTVLRSERGARVHVAISEAGYASATLRIDLSWRLPAALSADRLSRASEYLEHQISTFVTLAAGARRIEIATEWENRSCDHRLRALFPLGAPVEVSYAEGHFDVVERPVSGGDSGSGWDEMPTAALPQQGWVSVGNGAYGLMIANRGLPEFEVQPDGTIALTLLRAVGWLSRDDLLTRSGGAGPQIPTPEGQCLGRQRAEYAIIPHAGDWLASRAYQAAHEYLAPLYGSATGRHPGQLPLRDGLLVIEGDHTLLLSACKKAERSDALILRFWNVAKQPTTALMRFRQPPASVRLVDLREQPIDGGELVIAQDGSFRLSAGPAKIITVAIHFRP